MKLLFSSSLLAMLIGSITVTTTSVVLAFAPRPLVVAPSSSTSSSCARRLQNNRILPQPRPIQKMAPSTNSDDGLDAGFDNAFKDDWHSDYDASKYDYLANNNNSYGSGSSSRYDDSRASSFDRPGRGGRGGGRGRGRGGGGGGGGGLNSNHDYERDISSDASHVDVDAVNALLGDRLHARKTGDFDVADQIRDQLRSEYSVTVFDQDKMWSTGEGMRSIGGRSGRGRGGRGGGRGGRGRGGGRGGRRGDFRDNFGPTGHDYNLSRMAGPNSSQLSETTIHGKVAERLYAKMNRDFDTADRVQLELAEEGVFVNDRTKEWRADGIRFIDPSEGRSRGREPTVSDRNRPYVQSRHSRPLPENAKFTMERIGELVAERTQCKKDRRFSRADSILESLEEACDVAIDDRVREWSIGGSFGKETDMKRATHEALKSRSYVKSSASLELPDGVSQNDVQARVDARTRARTNRQYKESDALRNEILEDFNVIINDSIKMWSVGGDFGSDDPANLRAQERGKYTRRGGGNLSQNEVGLIQEMLKNRFELKRDRNFDKADEIRSHLYEKYKVNIDDKSQEWRVLSDDYVQTKAERGAEELTGMDVSVIESQLAKRIIFKKNRNYEQADLIRDDLQGKYSILIDDKKKEWKVISSSGKSKFVARGSAARSSQPPPYKQTRIEAEVEHDPWFDDDDNDDTTTDVITADDTNDAADVSSQSTISRDELMSLTVPLLKEKLREAAKPVGGKKAELVDRLLA